MSTAVNTRLPLPSSALRKMIPVLVLFFLCLLQGIPLKAQDTTAVKSGSDTIRGKEHSPKKATLFSAVCPGLGQAYNHKYWKVPIVYAGFGATVYFITFNTKYYKDFRDAYAYATGDKTGDPPNDLAKKYSSDQLLTAREYYRRNLEISYIATGVWYILNIVDATVDAHFYNYNISDDLSLRVSPLISPVPYTMKPATGLTFTMRF